VPVRSEPSHTGGHLPEDFFGEDIAARYDAGTADLSTPEVVGPVVEFLANLAGDGSALEFGIGTGRIGLPLHQRGTPVAGIDLSAAMLERLRAKAGAETISATQGDFATTRVDGTFSLVYLVFNTINNLTTQDEQVACFQNAADHLEPGGFFVVEVGVPSLRMMPPGQNRHVFHMSENRWGIDEYHFATQDFVSHHFAIRDGQLSRNSVPFRYVFPEELDLMARLAGMTRYGRWAGWENEPFTDDSTMHVSVWLRAEA
jgi:SAM-dependent methyltransferase